MFFFFQEGYEKFLVSLKFGFVSVKNSGMKKKFKNHCCGLKQSSTALNTVKLIQIQKKKPLTQFPLQKPAYCLCTLFLLPSDKEVTLISSLDYINL